MAGSPEWKVFDRHGTYQAAVKEPEAAAVLVSWYGDGASVRWGHATAWTVWREGQEAQRADKSYDVFAHEVLTRLIVLQARAHAKQYGTSETKEHR